MRNEAAAPGPLTVSICHVPSAAAPARPRPPPPHTTVLLVATAAPITAPPPPPPPPRQHTPAPIARSNTGSPTWPAARRCRGGLGLVLSPAPALPLHATRRQGQAEKDEGRVRPRRCPSVRRAAEAGGEGRSARRLPRTPQVPRASAHARPRPPPPHSTVLLRSPIQKRTS